MTEEVWFDVDDGGSGEVWFDVPDNTPSFRQLLESEASLPQKAASGFLSGVAGLGDLADVVHRYNPLNFDGALYSDAPPEFSLGDTIRSGIDWATGVEGSTNIGGDSLAHKIGEYLPSVLMGPGVIGTTGAAKGLVSGTGAKNLTKLLAADAGLGTAGYVGEQLGGPVGEIAAVLGTSSLPLAGQKLYSALVDVPSESQALIKAFKVPETQVNKVAPSLESLKAQGIITPPSSTTPFQDIAKNLEDAMTSSRSTIADALKGTERTIADVWPSSSMLGPKVKSGADSKAALSALTTEQDNLIKYALLKKSPPPLGVDELQHAENLLSKYKGLESAAKLGDKKASSIIKALDETIDNTPISGPELWDLRQSYDSSASWNKIEPKGKSLAYRAMRDDLQKQLLDLGGPGTDKLFDDFAAQMKAEKSILKLKGAEKKGTTQAPSKLQEVFGNTAKATLAKTVGIGHMPPVKPETSLRQAFGNTASQQFAKWEGPKELVRTGAIASGSQIGPLGNKQQKQDRKEPEESSTSFNSTTTRDLVEEAIRKAEANMKKEDVIYKDNRDLEPLVKAVTYVESRGKKDAVSPKGATGLMQIMPATAREIAEELGIEDYDLRDPKTNTLFGTHYLKKMLKMFGDPELALAAYNWGPGNMKKLLKRTGATSFEEIQHYLPSETKKYVPSVLKRLKTVQV